MTPEELSQEDYLMQETTPFPYSTITLPDGIVIGGPWPDTIIAWPNGNSRRATKPEYDLFQALEKANAATISPFVWSDKAPTEPGWYWIDRKLASGPLETIVYLRHQRAYGNRLCAIIDRRWEPVEDFIGDSEYRWAGPITPPQNP